MFGLRVSATPRNWKVFSSMWPYVSRFVGCALALRKRTLFSFDSFLQCFSVQRRLFPFDFRSFTTFHNPSRAFSCAPSQPIRLPSFGVHLNENDTIYALSSGYGKAGVAVIRVSGPHVRQVVEHMVQQTHPKSEHAQSLHPIEPRKAHYRSIVHPVTKERIDHGLVLYFPGPGSFTGEDTVEFHVHGGRAVVHATLSALQECNAILSRPQPGSGSCESNSRGHLRSAEPGEFTMRAFHRGKLDLTKVEALADLIAAETDAQRKQALRQLEGGLKVLYEGWREELIRCLAHVEAVIDFAEDELIDEEVARAVFPRVRTLSENIRTHLNDHRRGELLRSGVHVAIVGPPNAGKSSLLNILANRRVSIVSPIPGTTRDVVETTLDIGGFPLVVGDTAGLRGEAAMADEIEREGMRLARERASTADIRVAVFDGEPVAEVFDEVVDSNTIVVLNKSDVWGHRQSHILAAVKNRLQARSEQLHSVKICSISCHTGAGIAELLKELENMARERVEGSGAGDMPALTRARHRELLHACLASLEKFLDMPDLRKVELAAEHLRQATQHLGRITGRVDVEEVLDVVFRDFCIGK